MQRQRRLTTGEIETLVRAYEAGDTISALVERFHVSRATVMAHLRRAGVKTRYNRLDDKLNEAKRLYVDEGWSLARIAEQFGVTAGTVRNAFTQTGVPTRPVGTNQWSGRARS
jgi:DNA-directed RNA polymerase specialized sigma24 family protein